LTGSALLALALVNGAMEADQVWRAAHVDEDFNMETWGRDDQVMARRDFRAKEFDAAAQVLARVG
jgi:chaperone required for assembly of F1-ATPase